MPFLRSNSIDLICAHPPYGPAIHYSDSPLDLSRLRLSDYSSAMTVVARELYRVLKPGGFCAVLVADYRRGGILYPVGFRVFEALVDGAGFEPQDVVIKTLHADKTIDFYRGGTRNLRYRIAHEYLFLVRKPSERRRRRTRGRGPSKAR